MEHMINDRLIVDEPDSTAERFYRLTGCNIDWKKINNYVASDPAGSVYYLDEYLKEADEENGSFAWIDTGARTDGGKPVFLSLINRRGYYSGHFLGTGDFLLNGICSRNTYRGKTYRDNYRRFEKKLSRKRQKSERPVFEPLTVMIMRKPEKTETAKADAVEEVKPMNGYDKKLSDVTEEIYSDLLYPVWNSVEGLDTYIKVIGRRIPQMLESGRNEYLLQNKLGNVIVNTGLLDTYGNDFLVLYRKYVKQEAYKAYRIIHSRSLFEEEGFTRKESSKDLKPIDFFEIGEERFSAVYDDFDINMRCLKHIVDERRERFPEDLRSETSDKVARIVLDALRIGLKIQERDPYYAKAIYTGGRISWLLPLRVSASYMEEPELALVMRKEGEYYQLKTILPYDGALKDRITSTGLYRKSW